MDNACEAPIVAWTAAVISLLALLISSWWSWRGSEAKKGEYYFEAARLIISELNTEIPFQYIVTHWGSISFLRHEKTLVNMAKRFAILHKLLEKINGYPLLNERYLFIPLESYRNEAANNLKLLVKSFSYEKNMGENNKLSATAQEGFAYLLRFIYAPNIQSCSLKYCFSPIEQKEVIADLMDGSHLQEDFLKSIFSYPQQQ